MNIIRNKAFLIESTATHLRTTVPVGMSLLATVNLPWLSVYSTVTSLTEEWD
jgi:hypothetical protein